VDLDFTKQVHAEADLRSKRRIVVVRVERRDALTRWMKTSRRKLRRGEKKPIVLPIKQNRHDKARCEHADFQRFGFQVQVPISGNTTDGIGGSSRRRARLPAEEGGVEVNTERKTASPRKRNSSRAPCGCIVVGSDVGKSSCNGLNDVRSSSVPMSIASSVISMSPYKYSVQCLSTMCVLVV